MSIGSQFYIQKIRNHRPLTKKEARFSITLRWLTSILFGSLFPLGLWIGISPSNPFPQVAGIALVALSASGGLVLASAWLARHRHGLDGQWGYAPLTAKEISEVCSYSDFHPELGAALGELAVKCADKGCPLRGRDLLMIRRYGKKFKFLVEKENKEREV